jgi:hypothetical protein
MDSEKKPLLIFKETPGIIAWPCTISVPVSGGGRQDQEVTARFNVISRERFDELVGDPLSRVTRPEGAAPQGDIPLLNEVLVGFDGMKDETGATVDDARAKASLMALPYAVQGLARGYVEMIGLRPSKN